MPYPAKLYRGWEAPRLLHSIVETPSYLASAKATGLTAQERTAIVDSLAADPTQGDMIVGSGGLRKWRFGGRGKGKSGGFRIISWYAGDKIPAFLLLVFAKGDRIDLSQAERAALKSELVGLADDYRRKGTSDMTKAGDRILASVREARRFARGETSDGFVVHVPNTVDVRAIRERRGVTQEDFARRFGFSTAAVRDWEQGRRQPEQAARVLLLVIRDYPDIVESVLRAEGTPAPQ